MSIARVSILSPEPLQVVQRSSVLPAPGGATLTVRGTGALAGTSSGDLRLVECPDAFGPGTPWVTGALELDGAGGFTLRAPVGAGGWFRLEVRLRSGDEVVAEGTTEPVGVGEVLLVAGQSYAASCHTAVTTVTDPMGRVVTCSPESPGWRIAHDPQPGISSRIDTDTAVELMEKLEKLDLSFPHGPHSPFRGSIWPTAGNLLVDMLRVPIGLVHTAVGGTRLRHWRSGTRLFGNLVEGVRVAGDVRAVLWQQGESDAQAGTATPDYVAGLRALRADFCAATDRDRPWVLAKSTHHPTGDGPADAGVAVRTAVHQLCGEPGFVAGPDTDALHGEDYRARWHHGAHFTALGQVTAGRMWAAVLVALVAGADSPALGVSSSADARTP